MKVKRLFFSYLIIILILFFIADIVSAQNRGRGRGRGKPPWAGEDWNPAKPPAAPEPIAMTLIGMGGSAAVGFYLGKKKRKKDDDNQ